MSVFSFRARRRTSCRFVWACAALLAVRASAGEAPKEVPPDLSPPVTDDGRFRPLDKVRALSNPKKADPSERITLNGSASRDPEGDALIFKWEQVSGPAVDLQDAGTARPWFVPPGPGAYVFSLVVSDGISDSEPSEVRVAIKKRNRRPIARATSIRVTEPGSEVVLDGRASSDTDGDPITFRWRQLSGPRAGLRDESKALCRFTPKRLGLYRFELVVSDGAARSAPVKVTVQVGAQNARPTASAGADVTVERTFGAQDPERLGNTHPVIHVQPGMVYPSGSWITLDASRSTDAEDDALQFFWQQVSGPIRIRSWKPAPGSRGVSKMRFRATEPGDYIWRVQATDGLADSAWVTVRVRVRSGNDFPVANAGADLTGFVGRPIFLDGNRSRDPGGGKLLYHWRLITGSAKAQIVMPDPRNPARRRFVPKAEGTYIFELVVSDSKQWSRPDRLTVRVLAANKPPGLRVPRRQAVRAGERVVLALEAEDPEGQPVTVRLTQQTGARVKLARQRRAAHTWSFVPLAPGDYAFRAVATDGIDESEPRMITVQVTGGRHGRAPVARAPRRIVALTGRRVELDASRSSDPDGDRLRFRWTQSAGPRVKLHDSGNSQCWFVAEQRGRYAFTFVVSDGRFEAQPRTVIVDVRIANRKPVAEARLAGEGQHETPHEDSASADPGQARNSRGKKPSGP